MAQGTVKIHRRQCGTSRHAVGLSKGLVECSTPCFKGVCLVSMRCACLRRVRILAVDLMTGMRRKCVVNRIELLGRETLRLVIG